MFSINYYVIGSTHVAEAIKTIVVGKYNVLSHIAKSYIDNFLRFITQKPTINCVRSTFFLLNGKHTLVYSNTSLRLDCY